MIERRLFIVSGLICLMGTETLAQNDIADHIFSQTNRQRAALGLRPLNRDNALDKMAIRYAGVMAKLNKMGHSVDGSTVTDRAKRIGYKYRFLSENVAWKTPAPSIQAQAAGFVDIWMKSDGHRKNILSNKSRDIGIGIGRTQNRVYAAQVFGTQK